MFGDFFLFFAYNSLIIFLSVFSAFFIYGLISSRRRIQEFSCEEKKEINPVIREIMSLAKNKRRLAVLELKNQLYRQKIMKSIINSAIVDSLIKKEGCDVGRLTASLFLARKMPLPTEFVSLTANRISEVIFRCQRISDYLKEKANLNDLFLGVSGKYPYGNVSVLSGNIVLVFVCENSEDFASLLLPEIYSSGYYLEEEELARYISSIGGCFLKKTLDERMNGLVVVIKKNDLSMSAAYIHEVQHAINDLFCFGEKIKPLYNFDIFDDLFVGLFMDNIFYLKIICNRLWKLRLYAESRAKDEILSYLRCARYHRDIFRTLAKRKESSGSYDYLSTARKAIKDYFEIAGFSKDEKITMMVDEVLRHGYVKSLRSAVEACIMLEKAGFNRGEVIGILIDEPLSSWKKIAIRIRDAGGLDLLKDLW